MKLSKLVCEVVFLALITSSEAAEPAKNETAASSQAAKPAAQTASVATPATTVNQAADQASHVASRPVSAASSYTGYSAYSQSALNSTKRLELDISKRTGTTDYSFVTSSLNNTSKFTAYYGTVFAKVKDGDFVLWDGKETESSLKVELTSDYRVTVTLQNGKVLMFQKGYKRWLEYDPKQVEVANYVDASGFSMGWEVHEAPAEAEKKEGEDSKEGSKSGKSGRKVPGWGISLIAISATVLVVSIGVAVGVRMRK